MNNLKLAKQALQNQLKIELTPQPTPAPPISSWSQWTEAKNLGQLIRKERKAQALTQRNLAYKAGMSQASVTRAEKHGWVSISAWIKLAHALNKQLTIK